MTDSGPHTAFAERFSALKEAVGRSILGQDGVIEDLIVVVLAGGHAHPDGAGALLDAGAARVLFTHAELREALGLSVPA